MENNDLVHLHPNSQAITPANFITISRETFLRVYYQCNTGGNEVTISGNVLRPDGSVQKFSHIIPSSTQTSPAHVDIQVPEGLLLGVTAILSTIKSPVPLYLITIELRNGTTETSSSGALLLQTTLNPYVPAGFPNINSPIVNLIKSVPANESAAITVYSADAEALVPDQYFNRRLNYVNVVLTTTSTAGNRTLCVANPNTNDIIACSPVTQAPSTTKTYCIGHFGEPSKDYTNFILINVPPMLMSRSIGPELIVLNADDEADTFDSIYIVSEICPVY